MLSDFITSKICVARGKLRTTPRQVNKASEIGDWFFGEETGVFSIERAEKTQELKMHNDALTNPPSFWHRQGEQNGKGILVFVARICDQEERSGQLDVIMQLEDDNGFGLINFWIGVIIISVLRFWTSSSDMVNSYGLLSALRISRQILW